MDAQKKPAVRHVTVCLDEKTLNEVRMIAEKSGRSLSRQIAWMVKKVLAGYDKNRG